MTKIINVPMGDDGTKKIVVTGTINIDYSPVGSLEITGLPFTNVTGWCFFNRRELRENDSAYNGKIILACSSFDSNRTYWDGSGGSIAYSGWLSSYYFYTTPTYASNTLSIEITSPNSDIGVTASRYNGRYAYVIWGD